MLKHGELASKFRSKDKAIPAERDEDMFEAALERSKSRVQMDVSGRRAREELDRKQIDARLEEATIPEMEVMSVDEVLEGLVGKMHEVSSKLKMEDGLARDIHKMGAEVTSETRTRIKTLESKQNELMRLHAKIVAPNLKAAFSAKGRGEELLIPKPAEWDALMSNEDIIELKPSMQKRPSSLELQTKEAQLREEAEQTEHMIDQLIDEVHGESFFSHDKNKKPEHYLTTISKTVAEDHVQSLYQSLKDTRNKIRDIEINLGMVRRLEG